MPRLTRLRTSGAVRMSLADLPPVGVFVVCRDSNGDVVVLPVDERSFIDHDLTVTQIIDTLVSCSVAPDVYIEQSDGDSCDERVDTRVSQSHEKEDIEKHGDNESGTGNHNQWKGVQYPSCHMMTQSKPTVFGAEVYASPMEAYAMSLILHALEVPSLPHSIQGGLSMFELSPTQLAILAPQLTISHASGRFGVHYTPKMPDQLTIQATQTWLQAGIGGGVVLFLHGALAHRPCPCGVGGLKVLVYVYVQGEDCVAGDHLWGEWMIVYRGDEVPPRIDKLGSTLHNGVADGCMTQLPDNIHVLGRMVTRRSADALAIMKGPMSPIDQERETEGYSDLLEMYQPVIRQTRKHSKRPHVEKQGTQTDPNPSSDTELSCHHNFVG
jgi:hypothetical protein